MNTIFSVFRLPHLSGVVGGIYGTCRTMFTRPLVPHALSSTPTPVFGLGGGGAPQAPLLLRLQTPFGVIGRTNVRNHFPRPNERKRILRHGWKQRMSTAAGRRVLMRRILKGRHILSH
ncbi:large ribosomal subunit protein bL34m [Cherax quadricarinatus]|uniref:large ribosomal subunit protein bL34m n=1 Tax=Cherax quadricarinatus TaxID=27406 RepID=UPI00387E9D1E